jgi:hypothetical protein
VAYKLERWGGPGIRDNTEPAAVVDSYESAGVRERQVNFGAAGPDAIRKCRFSAQGAPVASIVMRLAVNVPLTCFKKFPFTS